LNSYRLSLANSWAKRQKQDEEMHKVLALAVNFCGVAKLNGESKVGRLI